MKTLYLDCSSGISGNMFLGALLDAGLPADKLRIPHSALRIKKVRKHGISGIHLEVIAEKQTESRNLKDILSIIGKSKLNPNTKQIATAIFRRLAEVEAKVHGIPVNKVHFHEVGAIDSIVDIVGAAIGIDYFGIEEVKTSPINVGSGWIKTAHGKLPVPAPATTELLKGFSVYNSGIKKELTTPTGAAIISTLAKPADVMPRLKVEAIGFGAGTYDLAEQPNLLRIFIGESELPTEKDTILQIETNIDDMDPRLYDKAIAALMKAGALDAYIEPLRMKKQRNAIQLVALCRPEDKESVLEAVFDSTTTLGVRVFMVQREKLQRKIEHIKTKFGKVKVKWGLLGKKLKTYSPEYEDLRKISKKHRVPLSRIAQTTLFKSF
ncbi:MAG: nickel pincer cofactor biosynthesis protein LarC [Candidatus Margulisiibacteriota bacterium]